MKPLFVILVTYRRFEHFKQTVESLLPTLPAGSRLFVVFNDPNDTQSIDWFDRVKKDNFTAHGAVDMDYLEMNQNRGWANAMNVGLESASRTPNLWKEYEYVLESNNDVTYEPDWFERAKTLMQKYPRIGILGLWSHTHHSVAQEFPDLLVKDNMPACAWLFRSPALATFLPFKEKGPCKTRGGNGEDGDMVLKVQSAGMWVCGPKPDLAHHMDGYDLPDLGKVNPAYK